MMESSLRSEQVRSLVLSLPEIAAWPEAISIFPASKADDPVRLDWELPYRASRALGADAEAALAGVGAVACLQISIILVDDILDMDPRGSYHRLGFGRAANLALAFQAAGSSLLEQSPAPADARVAASAALSKAALATAFGQELDVQNLQGEENYWKVIRAKSTPFYGAALQIGALLGGASPATAQRLYDFGVLFGEAIQIFDDLTDAFEAPANPDWGEGRNNLAILYATTAGHDQRDQFLALRSHVSEPTVLGEAQRILITCGSVSYCVYQLIQRTRIARGCLASLSLADPEPLAELLTNHLAPVVQWLPSIGVAIPAELQRLLA